MTTYKFLNYLVAAVWMVNGLFCKLLNLVPRHQQIVARILGEQHAAIFTKLIGLSEILMAAWIISNIKPRLNALAQVMIITVMNTLEFILVPDLLLWGRLNALFAFILILIVLYNEFYLRSKAAVYA
ncbi:MAG: DoxX-like family protein [Ferruginibacter sp.]